MAIVNKTIDIDSPLTDEQLKMLEESSKRLLSYDKDNPFLTKEELAQFKRVSNYIKDEKSNNRKQNVTLRLSPQAIQKAKALGKGYTSILAQIIESALDNPDLTEKLIISNRKPI